MGMRALQQAAVPGEQFDGKQVAEEILGLAHAQRADFRGFAAHRDAVADWPAAMEFPMPTGEHGGDACHWFP